MKNPAVMENEKSLTRALGVDDIDDFGVILICAMSEFQVDGGEDIFGLSVWELHMFVVSFG